MFDSGGFDSGLGFVYSRSYLWSIRDILVYGRRYIREGFDGTKSTTGEQIDGLCGSLRHSR